MSKTIIRPNIAHLLLLYFTFFFIGLFILGNIITLIMFQETILFSPLIPVLFFSIICSVFDYFVNYICIDEKYITGKNSFFKKVEVEKANTVFKNYFFMTKISDKNTRKSIYFTSPSKVVTDAISRV